MTDSPNTNHRTPITLLDRLIRFCLEQKLVVVLITLLVIGWGIVVAPFDWKVGWLPRNPVPVDAIPNLGENQQIVFTDWMGRSPQDVEDQVTYPLTVTLMGVPGVKDVRSLSMFGFSTISLIFDEDIEFYWARARIIEKLNSLPEGLLPADTKPALGPDATALGQVFWYTLEGRDPDGAPTGGWDLHELRSVQDWYVRYGLLAAEGISEVASIGGFVREYQVDVNPDALRAHGVMLEQVVNAVRKSNLDIGARSTEINRVEYLIRGRGFIRGIADIEQAVVKASEDHLPIRIKDVATVTLGPAERRGALDKGGAETVGGVVVVRESYNPLQAIHNTKEKIREISPGLPAKAVIDWTRTTPDEVRSAIGDDALEWLRAHSRDQWPEWITLSKVEIVPFYDRTGLIGETLGTLNDALLQQILVTIIVVIVMVMHLRASIVISMMLPMAVLMCFIAMKLVGVDSNVVSLAGIAIAIGAIVDMGLIITENVLKHLEEAPPDEPRLDVVYRATTEVGSAILTAISTTVISFLPVFTMMGAEGKMFTPLAYTKSFVLFASVITALTLVPAAAHILIAKRYGRMKTLPKGPGRLFSIAAGVLVLWLLTDVWEPLGPERGFIRNLLFVTGLIGGLLGLFLLFQRAYGPILRWALAHKAWFLSMPGLMILFGLCVWLGFDRVWGFVPAAYQRLGGDPQSIRTSKPWSLLAHEFPGLGREFMPALDEGSFLWMPTTMPHASIGEVLEVMQMQDMAFAAIPEVETVVGKLGRAESALDPAPTSMIETVIQYKPEYITDAGGRRVNFKYDRTRSEYVRDDLGELIPDSRGRPYRQWREHIHTPDDIWNEIVKAGAVPGTTSAPKLQPIETRLVMLQTGMRASMGVKVRAPDLETLDRMSVDIEAELRRVPGIVPGSVNAERVVGKPYLEIEIDRERIARYGLNIMDVQEVLSVAVGGETLTTTVEGRERYPVRVRYPRELRNTVEDLERILIPAMDGAQIPLIQIADIHYVRGPQMIRSENTFLTAYVTFGSEPGVAEVDIVEKARSYLEERVQSGDLIVPAGVSYAFAGAYEHQIRAMQTLSLVVPVSLFIIFIILYFQFKTVGTTLIVFSSIAVAWAGGFVMIYLYGQDWFANFHVFGVNMRDLFNLHAINLSVAVWVGFLALFGIASDDGVVMATYLKQSFENRRTKSIAEIREATVAAGLRRVRPCLMTSATTILALLPVLTSTGRGADIMIPMAIPSVGGMSLVMITMFTVPVLFCAGQERRFKRSGPTMGD